MSNFWRPLDLNLNNCTIESDLTWSKDCIISQISRTAAVTAIANANPLVQAAAVTETNKATFQRNNVKLYVPVVTLPIHDKIDLLGNIRQGFKRPITWSEYKSEITKLPKKTIISII